MRLYNLFCGIIKELSDAPDSQLSSNLRNKCSEFLRTERSESELSDFLDYISQQPLTEASQFVKTLCDVNRFYN